MKLRPIKPEDHPLPVGARVYHSYADTHHVIVRSEWEGSTVFSPIAVYEFREDPGVYYSEEDLTSYFHLVEEDATEYPEIWLNVYEDIHCWATSVDEKTAASNVDTCTKAGATYLRTIHQLPDGTIEFINLKEEASG